MFCEKYQKVTDLRKWTATANIKLTLSCFYDSKKLQVSTAVFKAKKKDLKSKFKILQLKKISKSGTI